jgi:hypothetical protein
MHLKELTSANKWRHSNKLEKIEYKGLFDIRRLMC